MLYFMILTSFAEKPSKIPSDTKVGKELFQQHCQGCHQLPKSEDAVVNNANSQHLDSQNSEIATDENISSDSPEDSNMQTSIKDPLLTNQEDNRKEIIPLLSVSSNEIHIINEQSIPSITSRTYSNEDWLTWVLQGKGMMPSYGEIFHSTDALKIKAYLDGL